MDLINHIANGTRELDVATPHGMVHASHTESHTDLALSEPLATLGLHLTCPVWLQIKAVHSQTVYVCVPGDMSHADWIRSAFAHR